MNFGSSLFATRAEKWIWKSELFAASAEKWTWKVNFSTLNSLSLQMRRRELYKPHFYLALESTKGKPQANLAQLYSRIVLLVNVELARLGNLLFASAASTCGHRRFLVAPLVFVIQCFQLNRRLGRIFIIIITTPLAICAFYGRQWNQMARLSSRREKLVIGRPAGMASLRWRVPRVGNWAGSFPWLGLSFKGDGCVIQPIAGLLAWSGDGVYLSGRDGRKLAGARSLSRWFEKICMATVSSAIASSKSLERGISLVTRQRRRWEDLDPNNTCSETVRFRTIDLCFCFTNVVISRGAKDLKMTRGR